MGCRQLIYVAMGVHPIVGARIYVNYVVVDRSRRRRGVNYIVKPD